MIVQIVALFWAAFFYSLKELCAHGKIKWTHAPDDFFGAKSWGRKYKGKFVESIGEWYFEHAPDTWYYNWFKIENKERFPLSATVLSFLTDGMHLFQMFFKINLSIAIAGISWWAVAWFVAWSCIFTVVYKYLSR